MRTCVTCHQDKDEIHFAKKTTTLQSSCKECQRIYSKEWYKRTKEERQPTVIANKNRIKQTLRAYLVAYCQGKCCVDCGNDDFRTFQFDHRDQSDKTGKISDMVCRRASIERLQAELAKCDIRCANCHQIRTGKQLSWWWS